MARRRGSSGGENAWQNACAGLAVLPLIFLVPLLLLYPADAAGGNAAEAFTQQPSSAVITADIPEEPAPDIDTAPPENPRGLNVLYNTLDAYLRSRPLSAPISLERGEGYVLISFYDHLLFEPGSARLRPADIEILNFVGRALKASQQDAALILIGGHTAGLPEGADSPAWDRRLSSECADAVLVYLESEIGIDSGKLISVAYGKNRPVSDNDTPEGVSRNRRVEILITAENAPPERLGDIYK